MQKLLALLAVLSFPILASAQETYSIPLTTNQTNSHERDRAATNRQTCKRLSLATSCTQAQACTAANAAGGASCTAQQARDANARMFPNTQPGREEFMTYDLVLPGLQRRRNAATDEQNLAKEWFLAQNQGTKDAECSKWGLAAGCNPYE